MKLSNLLPVAFSYFLIILICGCTRSEVGESKDVAQETIYQQYKVIYNEGDENVTVFSQFRFAGDKGTTLVLNQPSNIQFDGVALPGDSSDYEGAFYKVNLPVKKFVGDHQFSFTDINKREYNNGFSFATFKLLNIPEAPVKDQPFPVQFEALSLGTDDYIELGAFETDSSFSLTYSAKDSGNSIVIPAEELQRQTRGQLKMIATFYRKMPLLQSTNEGGILEIIYTLKPFTIKLK